MKHVFGAAEWDTFNVDFAIFHTISVTFEIQQALEVGGEHQLKWEIQSRRSEWCWQTLWRWGSLPRRQKFVLRLSKRESLEVLLEWDENRDGPGKVGTAKGSVLWWSLWCEPEVRVLVPDIDEKYSPSTAAHIII